MGNEEIKDWRKVNGAKEKCKYLSCQCFAAEVALVSEVGWE